MGFETPGKVEGDWQNAIFSVDEILEDARNGRMFIWLITKTAKMRGIW